MPNSIGLQLRFRTDPDFTFTELSLMISVTFPIAIIGGAVLFYRLVWRGGAIGSACRIDC